MTQPRLQRRSAADRFLAGLLLSGFLLLTTAPVCGSPTDVDPAACCQRHGCHVPMPGSRNASQKRAGVRYTHPGVAAVTGSNSAAEDCCRRGSLAYPVVEAQSHTSVTASCVALQVVAARGDLRSLTRASGAWAPTLHAPLISLIALYQLNSSYRI